MLRKLQEALPACAKEFFKPRRGASGVLVDGPNHASAMILDEVPITMRSNLDTSRIFTPARDTAARQVVSQEVRSFVHRAIVEFSKE